jgi:hypothetical protein
VPRPFHLAKTSTESRQASEERLPKLAVDRFFLISRKRHSGVVAENGFEVPSYDDNSFGYFLLLFESDLPGRAVDPPGKADQPQEFPLIDRAARWHSSGRA